MIKLGAAVCSMSWALMAVENAAINISDKSNLIFITVVILKLISIVIGTKLQYHTNKCNRFHVVNLLHIIFF